MDKKELQEALQKSWIEGWNERKLFEDELLKAIRDDLGPAMTKEHSDILLQVLADFGNDGARFLPEEEQW